MARWWMGAALVTLGLAGRAVAQPMPLPGGGPGPMYPPTFANEPTPMSGPEFLPPGGNEPPPSPFSLPNDGSPNAWSKDDTEAFEKPTWYFSVGYLGLQRQKLGNGVIALRDSGNNLPNTPPNADTGIGAKVGAPQEFGFNDLNPLFSNGVRTSLGYREGRNALELVGWYQFRSEASAMALDPGRLDLPFASFPSPIGFQGDNFLWLQADRVQTTLVTEVASGELNYRHQPARGFDWIFGIRYLYLRERFSILTDDDGLTVQPVNLTQVATYSVASTSNIVAPQFGFEWEYPLVSWATVGVTAKGAWGANFVEVNSGLMRGDGFAGPENTRHATIFSQLYEMSAWATFAFTEQWRIRAGYTALWVLNVPVANQQIDFNPGTPNTHVSDNGSIFWHGPMLEMQFAF